MQTASSPTYALKEDWAMPGTNGGGQWYPVSLAHAQRAFFDQLIFLLAEELAQIWIGLLGIR